MPKAKDGAYVALLSKDGKYVNVAPAPAGAPAEKCYDSTEQADLVRLSKVKSGKAQIAVFMGKGATSKTPLTLLVSFKSGFPSYYLGRLGEQGDRPARAKKVKLYL